MKNLKKNILMTSCLLMMMSSYSFANKTMGEKAHDGYEKTKDVVTETYEDTRDGAKKAYRKVDEEACEMVNGKMKCVSKKVANKTKNAADTVKDKANDVKRH